MREFLSNLLEDTALVIGIVLFVVAAFLIVTYILIPE
jgi:hypothetical protein